MRSSQNHGARLWRQFLLFYVSRILRLALLAPDIIEAILSGWADERVMLERPLPISWGEQREHIIS